MRLSAMKTLLMLAVVLLVGCVDHDASSFNIEAHLAPDTQNECILEPSNLRVLRGAMNADVSEGYLLFPLYANRIRARGSDDPLRANPNDVYVTGAEIEVRDAAGRRIDFGGLPNPFTVPTSDFVPAAPGADTPGMGVGSIMGVPPAYGAVLATRLPDELSIEAILLSVQVFGETTGGVDVDAPEFIWPVDVCKGSCLLFTPTGDEEEVCCRAGQDLSCPIL